MFTAPGILSGSRKDAFVLVAIFASGLAVGAAMGPMTGSRSQIHEPLSEQQSRPTPSVTNTPRAAHPTEVLRVLDGDTFEARVRVWPGHDITTKIRLRGIDAPELRNPRCEQERLKAVAARDALQSILVQGDVGVSAVALDKYGGRVVADASARATPDVSAALLAAGFVRGYVGGRRETWCN